MKGLENLNPKNQKGTIVINYVEAGKVKYSRKIPLEIPFNKENFNEYAAQCEDAYENFPYYNNDISSRPWVIVFYPEKKSYSCLPGPYTTTGNEYVVNGCFSEGQAQSILRGYERLNVLGINEHFDPKAFCEGPSIFPSSNKISLIASSNLRVDEIDDL